MSESSGNLHLATGMTADKAMIFLLEAARYFASRPTGGEDRAHWSNVYNAENCRKIADFIASHKSGDEHAK